MRGIGKHKPPAEDEMQPCPVDNTSAHIYAQVVTWWEKRPLIHTEAAREIAAWYASGGNGFAVFASTGEIADGFADEIRAEYRRSSPEGGDDRREIELSALRAYVLSAS